MPKSVCRMILGWCFLHHWGLRQKQYIKNWETLAIIFTLYQNLYIMYILYIMYSIYLYIIYILYMTYLCTYLYKDLHKQEFSWGPAGSSHCAKKSHFRDFHRSLHQKTFGVWKLSMFVVIWGWISKPMIIIFLGITGITIHYPAMT